MDLPNDEGGQSLFHFDLSAKALRVMVETDEAASLRLTSDATSSVWGAEGMTVVVQADADARLQHVRLSAPSYAVRRLHLRWNLTVPAGLRYLGDHWERGYGDLEWRGLVPDRALPWYFLAYDARSGATAGCGVLTGANGICCWQVDSMGVSLYIDVRCGDRGVQLGDRTLQCATLITKGGNGDETPFEAARAFCRLLCPAPRLPAYPVYGGNDWYYAYGSNSDDSIRRDASRIREWAPTGDNQPFMVIDDGWEPFRLSGPYDTGNAKFPDMAALAAYMKRMEVRPGIWVRPLVRHDDAVPDSWRLPEAHPLFAEARRDGTVFLDPSVPEVLEIVRNDISRCAGEWGYELIKHDFTTYDLLGRWGFAMDGGAITSGGWSFTDRSRTTAEIIQSLYGTIRAAAGEETILVGCNTIGHLGAGLFEIQRTGDDTSGREWDRTRKMGVNTLAFRMAQHETFFIADADCVGLTRDIPWHLNRQWLDVLARSGTALFVSPAPDAVGPEQDAALREAFTLAAQPQPAGEPLDWLDTTSPRRWRFGDESAVYDWFD